MQFFKIIILLMLLPALFFVPYIIFTKDEKTDSSLFEKQFNLSKNKQPVAPKINTPKYDNKTKIVISEHRFEQKTFLKIDENTNIQNSVEYHFYAPPKPWPENIKFPLIIHFHDLAKSAYSADYITQKNMSLSFPAVSVIPNLEKIYSPVGGGQLRMNGGLQMPTHSKSRLKKTTKAVDYENLRIRSKQAIPVLNKLIDDLKTQHPIDEDKIYLIGCGYGGTTLLHMIEKDPQKYASAVAISTAWDTKDYTNYKDTPILLLTGEQNHLFKSFIARSFAANVKKAGGKAIYKGFESMPHTCSYKQFYASNVWKWMFAQKR